MLYGVVFGFILCGIVGFVKGNIDMLIICLFLAGLYLIPATINETYLKFYKTMCTVLEKSVDFMKEFNNKIKQEKEKQDEEK